MNLADVYGQMGAVSYARKPKRAPLAEEIHAELPAKIAEGTAIEEKKQFEEGLATTKEISDKQLKQTEAHNLASLTQEQKQHEESLAELTREHADTMTQKKKELEIAGETAAKSEGVQAIGMGISGGKLLSEWAKEGGGTYAGYASPIVVGTGVGYGIAKYTGSKTAGVAAGAGTALLANYLQSGGKDAVSMGIASAIDWITDLKFLPW